MTRQLKQLKIATLNLCLGLKNKKDLVKNILLSNEIDILAMQEIELESTFDANLLSIPGYTLETENTKYKKRVGTYIRTTLKYERMPQLEEVDNNLVIMNWRINKLLLPHNFYYGPRHITLFSQRPSHFDCSDGTLFNVTRQKQQYSQNRTYALFSLRQHTTHCFLKKPTNPLKNGSKLEPSCLLLKMQRVQNPDTILLSDPHCLV